VSKENSGSLLIRFNLFRCYYNNSLGVCLAFLLCASSACDLDFGDLPQQLSKIETFNCSEYCLLYA